MMIIRRMREDYQNCSVLYCVGLQQLFAVIRAHVRIVLTFNISGFAIMRYINLTLTLTLTLTVGLGLGFL